jgi:divalent metal cation (Fe/Co/Zn/Cd) transporter
VKASRTSSAPYLAAAVLAGLLANTTLGWWWLDPAVALGIAAKPIHEGREPGKAMKTGEPDPWTA